MQTAKIPKLEIRPVIKFLWTKGLNAIQIHQDLISTYGDQAPAYSTVAEWAAEFRRGRESLNDDYRSGRPLSSCTPENIERVRELIYADP